MEWFDNTEAGLEHGYQIDTRPTGDGALQIDIAFDGAELSVQNGTPVIASSSGRRLRYGHLVARDSAGRDVPANFEACGPTSLRLVVEDELATYPLLIDPLVSSMPDSRVECDRDNTQFATSVASAGDVNGDGYDDIIVGAPGYDFGPSAVGGAFIFLGSASGIANASTLTADAVIQSEQLDGLLGGRVAGAGDVNGDGYDDVIVGANRYAFNGFGGAAFVFHGGPSGIPSGTPTTASAILYANQVLADFGTSVSSAGDVNGDGYDDVIVGAPGYDSGQLNEGAAFIFHGSPSGVASGSPASANTILQSDQTESFLREVAGAGDVNGDGYDDVIVGAYAYSHGEDQEGAAFVFHGGPSGVPNGNPSTANALLESNQEIYPYWGLSLAGAGDVNGDGYDDVIVGASEYRTMSPDTAQGAAFVFHGGPSGITSGNPSTANASLLSDQTDSQFGYAVSGLGDVNGDGYGDIIVDSPQYSAGQLHEGVAFVYLGGSQGISASGPATSDGALETNLPGNGFYSTSGAGDVNGDGFDDVIVGEEAFVNSLQGEGAAFVYMGGTAFGNTTLGVYIPASGAFFLRNSNSPGAANVVFVYGPSNGGLVPIAGDWDGNGSDTVGLYDPATGAFFLRNSNSPGAADIAFAYGPAGLGWTPLVGDWDGDGTDTIGLYDPVSGFFFLKNSNASGNADLVYGFGPANAGWTALAGDFDGNGTTTVALFDPVSSVFFARNVHAPGVADIVYNFGPGGAGWQPLCGDFNGDGVDTFALYSPSNGFFFLRNTHAPGPADFVINYGPPQAIPLVGNWNGL